MGRPLWDMYDFPTRLLEELSQFLTGRPRGDPYKLRTANYKDNLLRTTNHEPRATSHEPLPMQAIADDEAADFQESDHGQGQEALGQKAASLMAQKDPVAYGVLNKRGNGLPSPHRQEGYIVHLGDHDWVLSSPAGQKTSALLKKIAVQQYGMSDGDSQGAKFNYFKNYIESQLFCMYLNMLQAEPDGERLVAQAVAKVIVK